MALFSLSLFLSRGEGEGKEEEEEEEGVLKSYCPLVLVGGRREGGTLSLYRLTEKWEDGTFFTLSLTDYDEGDVGPGTPGRRRRRREIEQSIN